MRSAILVSGGGNFALHIGLHKNFIKKHAFKQIIGATVYFCIQSAQLYVFAYKKVYAVLFYMRLIFLLKSYFFGYRYLICCIIINYKLI